MDILEPARKACQALTGSSLPRNRLVIYPQSGLARPGRTTARGPAGPVAITAAEPLLNIHSMLGIVLGGVTSKRDGSRRPWLPTQDERSFDERYRLWAGRSGELFAEASRYIPGGAGSSARTVKFGWKPYPPFMAEGTGSRLRDVDGHEYVDYLLGLGPMILGHRHPAVTRGRDPGRDRPGHLLRPALRAGDRGGPQGHRGRARRRPGPVLQLRQRGGRHGPPAGPRAHRPPADHPLRGPLPRLAGHHLLEQPRRPRAGRPGPHAAPGAVRSRRPGRARRHAHRADLERPRELHRGHGGARRPGGRGHHRARGVQHRVHPARARLPGTAARADPAARRAAHLRRGDHRLPVRAGRRPGVLRRDPGPDHHGQGPGRRLPGRRHRRVARGHVHDRRRPLLALRHLQRQHDRVRRGQRDHGRAGRARPVRAPARARRVADERAAQAGRGRRACR